jgi:hypothetical protein
MDKKSWMPSNGSEFQGFQETYCFYCTKEEGDGYCSISDLALEQKQPKEWTQDENFNPHCSGFQKDDVKWSRRNIAICHNCKEDINMVEEDYAYLCLPSTEFEGIECAYYCKTCKEEIK